MKKPLLTTTALIGLSILAICVPNPVHANPEGGKVVGGSATISENGKKLDVHQHSERAVIDWRSFDIKIDEHTEFHQPYSSATALNRINDVNPSRIAGKLSANGNIILVNPNGVFFEGSSRVDVNGIIATTANIRPEDFISGSNAFNIPGNPNAAIVNEGQITAKDAGLVGLVAPNVENHGVIQAKLGRIQLASGDTVTIDFYGDDLLKVAVKDENVKSQFVGNSGVLSADGGTVAMTATAAKQTVNSLIVAEGLIEAKTIGRDDSGAIIIGGEGSNKTEKSGNSYIAISGYLDASGRKEDEQGGNIEVLGDHIVISETGFLDTSGHSAIIPEHKPDTGTATMREDKTIDNGVRTEEEFLVQGSRAGGSIKVGGDYLGQGDTQTAKTVKVADGAVILNNALNEGDGGRTIIWSDDTTEFAGLVLSRGGENGGHGGFVETSGKINLKAEGYADLTAQDGFSKGTYLLDPADITIYGSADGILDPNDIDAIDGDATDLQIWLDASDATTITDAAGSVTIWADKSGNGYDFDDVGAGAEPSTGSRTINGLNALDFDGGDRLIHTSNAATIFAPNTNIYTFFVGEQDVSSPDIVIYAKNGAAGLQGGGTYDGNGGDGSLFELHSGFAGANVQNFIDDGPSANSTTPSAGVGNPSIIGGYFDRVSASVSAQSFVNGLASATTSGAAALDGTAVDAIIGGHGSSDANLARLYDGAIGEVIVFHNLSENERALVDQYQSVKWDIALNPLNNGDSEIDQATAATGYNAFSAAYLERLSASADIVLQADNTITLDLQGDTLALDAGRSLSLTTTNGTISDIGAMTGTLSTDNGNITLFAGGAGNIDLDNTNLVALNGGLVNLYAMGGNVDVTQVSSLNLGTVNAQNIALETTGAGSTISFTNPNTTLLGRAQGVTNTITTNDGAVTFHDDLLLADHLTINAGTGNVLFSGTVNSAFFIPAPNILSSSVLWFDANDLDGDGLPEGVSEANFDGTSITGWVNKVDSGNNGTGSTANLGDINGNTSVVFDNNTDIVTAPDVFGGETDEIYIFSVTQENARQQNFFLNFNGTNTGSGIPNGRLSTHIPWTNGAWYWDAGNTGGGRSFIGGGVTAVGDVTQATYYNSVSRNERGILLNGGAFSNINAGAVTVATAGGLRIGSFIAAPGNIELGELVAFNQDLNARDVDIIETYLADKWQNGITLGTDYDLSVTGGAVTMTGNAGTAQALNNLSILASGAASLLAVTAGSIEAHTTGAMADITTNGVISASDAGNSLVLAAGRNFINTAGAGALNVTDPGSRWLVYSSDPAANTLGGISADFKRYNRTFAGNAPVTITESDNALIYSIAPVINYNVDDLSVEYGEALGALSTTYVSGLIDGDTLGTIGQMNEPTLSTSYVAGTDADTYAGNLTGATGLLINQLGYQYAFNAGDLTVTQADLIISVNPSSATINQREALPSYNLSYGPFKLADTFTDLDVLPTITTPSNNAAGNFPITLSGGSDNNYNYIFTNGTLEILAVIAKNNNVIIPSTVEQDVSTHILGTRINNQDFNIPILEARSLTDSQIDIEVEGLNDERPELNSTEERKRKIKLKINKDLANQLNIQIKDGVL